METVFQDALYAVAQRHLCGVLSPIRKKKKLVCEIRGRKQKEPQGPHVPSISMTHSQNLCFSSHNTGVCKIEALNSYRRQKSYSKSPIELQAITAA